MLAAGVGDEAGAEQVAQVGGAGTEPDGLPVDDDDALAAEQQVVGAVVAMDDRPRARAARQVVAEPWDEPVDDGVGVGVEALGVVLAERAGGVCTRATTGVRRVAAVQPADRLQRLVAPAGAVEQRQLVDRRRRCRRRSSRAI